MIVKTLAVTKAWRYAYVGKSFYSSCSFQPGIRSCRVLKSLYMQSDLTFMIGIKSVPNNNSVSGLLKKIGKLSRGALGQELR